MRHAVPFVLLLSAASLFADDPKQSPLVTVPLAEYQKLTTAPLTPTTVVDTIQLAGSFHDNRLTIAFSGRAVGAPQEIEVLTGAKDLTISGCSGSAIVTRAPKAAFHILPLRDDFSARCDLRLSGSDRVQLHVPPTVLGVRSTVSDGELTATEEDGDNGRTYALVRQVAVSNETLPVTATGRYVVTLLPDAARFRYAIDVHNPNRATSSLTLRLVSGEHLQQIDSTNQYEVRDGRYVFAIAPGESTIVATGELLGHTFAVPVDAALQYLVVESHPLLRAATRGAQKRVSVTETGVRPTYRGAVAFELAGGEHVGWSVSRLEALHSISYALPGARHDFFVPADGSILGESSFEVRNQGAAEVQMPSLPRATYAALQDQPLLMTRTRDGHLTVPLSTGQQVLFLQHVQTFRHALGVGLATVRVPQLPIAATGTFASVRYASEWLPLVETFASRTKVWLPRPSTTFFFLLFALWSERLLAMLGMRRRRIVIALLVAATAASSLLLVGVTAAVLGILSVIALAPVAPQRWNVRHGVAALLASAVALALVIYPTYARIGAIERMNSGSGGLASSGPVTLDMLLESDEMSRAMGAAYVHSAAPPEGQSQEIYQGLPARFELPFGDRHTSFGTELLPVDRPQAIGIIMLSATLLWWLHAALLLLAGTLLWRERAPLAAAMRVRFAATAPEAALA